MFIVGVESRSKCTNGMHLHAYLHSTSVQKSLTGCNIGPLYLSAVGIHTYNEKS